MPPMLKRLLLLVGASLLGGCYFGPYPYGHPGYDSGYYPRPVIVGGGYYPYYRRY